MVWKRDFFRRLMICIGQLQNLLKKNTCPQIRLRLPMIKNEIKCGVYNQNRVFVGTDEVKEGSEVVLILHIRGLKVLKTIILL